MLQSKNHGNKKLHNSCNYVQKYPTTESQSVKLLTDDDSENYHILCPSCFNCTHLLPKQNILFCLETGIFSQFNHFDTFLDFFNPKVLLGGRWLIWVRALAPLCLTQSLLSLQPIRSTHTRETVQH